MDAIDVRMEEVRAYRRREVRRRKNVFQSRMFEEELGEVEVVEALRVRHNDGVKKDEGVVVEEGVFAATGERVDEGIRRRICGIRAAVETLHREFGVTFFEAFKRGRV